jgi:methionyl aminopeptidase
MEKKELEAYRKAGKIASEVREKSRELVRANVKILDIAEKVEKMIKDEGGKLAFPVNVCINDVTAHYTPKIDDGIKLTKDDVVSIDLGVHIDGYIADTAYTIDLSKKYKDMLKANQEALDAALELMKPGAEMAVIGKTVHDIITDAGFMPGSLFQILKFHMTARLRREWFLLWSLSLQTDTGGLLNQGIQRYSHYWMLSRLGTGTQEKSFRK